MNTDNFDHKCESVVVREQRSLAVFLNGSGSVVVRQECAWPDETEDPYVLIRPENAEAVARAILRAAAEAIGDGESVTLPVTRNSAGASRQRRYRERHRNGVTTITSRNGSERNDVTEKVTRNAGELES